MDQKAKTNLEQAKTYAYSMRMVEAYNILRRFYDRLPFQIENEHAEYISLFARVLSELGKEYELKFYLAELERWHEKSGSSAIKYQLAVVYVYLSEPRYETARKMLEEVLRDPQGKDFHAKAKMMLADYYDHVKKDTASCRRLIDSIEAVEDPHLKILVEIWKAKVFRDEGKFEIAEKMLLDLLKTIDPKNNWYAYFSAKVILAGSYVKRNNPADVAEILAELRKIFEGKSLKSAQFQLEALENLIAKGKKLGIIKFRPAENSGELAYENRRLALDNKQPLDRLVMTFLKKGYLDKALIVKTVYARGYEAKRDDKLVYYHIHSLRKKFKAIGIPSEAIVNEKEGYRLVPEVEMMEEEL